MDIGAKSAPARWPYRADRPQRYLGNYELYRRIGGPVNLEEFVKGFVAGGTNQADMARFYFFCLVFDQLVKEDIRGDLAELGVYKGNTASLLAEIARSRGATAYLLDTFTGFDKKDIRGVDSGAREEAFSDTSLEAVRALVGEKNVKYVQGYFPETAAQLPSDGSYCLVHIDCDLYAPITSALEYFYPRLAPGGFMIIHDYTSLHWNGAEKAVDEFFADKPEAVIPLPDGAGSVVIRKLRSQCRSDNWLLRKRASLLRPGEWISAANGELREILGFGWSGPEPWGVWGVGEAHELHLSLPSSPHADITLEADVHAVVRGRLQHREITVWAGGRQVAAWTFSTKENRGIRTVRVGASLPHRESAGVTVTFRPTQVLAPEEMDPSLSERRPLGLALHRIRCLP